MIKTILISKLKTNNGQITGLPKNPRFIRDERFEKLKQSITDLPEMLELRELIVYPQNGQFVTIAGNMRLRAGRDLGLKEMPCKVLDSKTPIDTLAEIAIKDNVPFGSDDYDILANEWTDFPLTDWGMEIPEFEAIDDEPVDASFETLHRAAKLRMKWKVESNQIWQIGRHRLLVGNCLDPALRAKLLQNTKFDLLHTDPPYGISIVAVKNSRLGTANGSKPFGATGGTSRRSSTGFDSSSPRWTGSVQRGPKSKNQIIQSNIYPIIEGDDKPFEPDAWFLKLAPIVVLWGANYFAEKLPASSGWLVWDKRENITRNTFADCEMAWTNQDKPARIFYHLWNGLHKGSQHDEKRTHPTEKPVALFEEIGRLYADKGMWLDLYAGTGAQMVAAERSDATCYATEIEPLYCAVILERMQMAFPHLEIKRIENAKGKTTN